MRQAVNQSGSRSTKRNRTQMHRLCWTV